MYKIPIYSPSLTGNEKKYVNECLDSTWISSKGRFVSEFETRFAKYTGVTHAATVSNGTVALHLALIALGVGPGDEVLVPTLTYVASVNAIAYTGATPVFVDSLRETWQIDPSDARKKVTSRTKAIIAVHLYGHPCDMDQLLAICYENGIFLVEDCAEAFGAFYKGKHVGSFGDIATYSFFGNKTITTGEGGMVVTNDMTLSDRVRHFKGQGLAAHREYWHDVIGYNYRMTNICAAIGLAQLEQADDFIAKKRQLADWYAQMLSGLPLTLHNEVGDVRHAFWMVSILVDDPTHRDALRSFMSARGIETRPVFFPVHTMPMYVKSGFARHPVAEQLGWGGINLPSWPNLARGLVRSVCDAITDYYGARA